MATAILTAAPGRSRVPTDASADGTAQRASIGELRVLDCPIVVFEQLGESPRNCR